MKPPPFGYHDPRTVPEVTGLLASLENSKLLAGGQSLMPMLNMRLVLPDHLIDLGRVEGLAYIRETTGEGKSDGDGESAIDIGAMTRQSDIEFSALVRERCPLMHEAILEVGHRQTRNRGTLGGSLCHLDPAAELVAVAAALDATVTVTAAAGGRAIAMADFPLAYMTPAIEPGELVTSVRFPLWAKGHGYAFVEFARRHGDFAIVSAAALLEQDAGGRISRVALALGGVAPAPLRLREVERALLGEVVSAALLREACEVCRNIEAMEDVHAPSAYRRQLATVMARRALEKAQARLAGAAK